MTKKHRKRTKNSVLGKLYKMRLHHKIIFALIGGVGAILMWRGVWNLSDLAPFLDNPFASVIAGLILLAISGLFFKFL